MNQKMLTVPNENVRIVLHYYFFIATPLLKKYLASKPFRHQYRFWQLEPQAEFQVELHFLKNYIVCRGVSTSP